MSVPGVTPSKVAAFTIRFRSRTGPSAAGAKASGTDVTGPNDNRFYFTAAGVDAAAASCSPHVRARSSSSSGRGPGDTADPEASGFAIVLYPCARRPLAADLAAEPGR